MNDLSFRCGTLAKALPLLLLPMLLGSARADLPLPDKTQLVAEVNEKVARVKKLLDEQKLGGLLLSSTHDIAWLTAGLTDGHVVITSEEASVSLLIMADGGRFAIASNSEAERTMSEDLAGLGFSLKTFRWFEDKGPRDQKRQLIDEVAAGRAIATDLPYGNLRVLDPISLHGLQVPLTASEITKYRWVGHNTADAVAAALARVKPGMSEREIETITSDELMKRRIRPTVLLVGTDERCSRIRHLVPTDDHMVRSYAMINVCARRFGLVAAVTRFVHFGPLPAELEKKNGIVARVAASEMAALKPGATAVSLLETAQRAYKAAGMPDEWQEHHQGGAIGYGERDWLVHPWAKERVVDREAFAFNPSVPGIKDEDTMLLLDGRLENLTPTPTLPSVTVDVAGQKLQRPHVWVRPATP